MDQEQAHDSHAVLLKRWIDVLHRWEEKKSHYQVELDKTTDPDKQKELEQGIDSCENVIQTSQGLIQALSDRHLSSLTDAEVLAAETSPLLPPESSPSSAINPQTSPSLLSGSEESSSLNTAPPVSPQIQPSPQLPTARTRPSSSSRSPTLKNVLRIGLPLLIIVAAGLTIFRPKNACKLAPDGTYSETGLAMRVRQALTDSEDDTAVQSVAIGQYGCTIVLEGTVPSQDVQRRIIDLAKAVTIPSQSPIEQVKRALGLESGQINPVQDVVSKLTVTPSAVDAQ